MMSRALEAAILHSAALLVPSSAREEWLAEWNAELWYVERDTTAFCLGSFRDAFWLRIKSVSARRVLSLDSPSRCILFLSGLAALTLLVSAPPHSLSSLSWPKVKQLAISVFWMYFEASLILLTLSQTSGSVSVKLSRALAVKFRRGAFLASKIAFLPLIVFFATNPLALMFPPAACILFVGLIFGLRWALADQRQRCPICLHMLSDRIEIGSAAHTLFRPYGTELSCIRGHGPFYLPGTDTSWCTAQ